jgi:hemoglobin
MATTAFERCGGFATVRKVVSAFYDKVLDSPSLRRYFDGVDMRSLIDHQTKFIASVMGGPASYDDEQLRRAHARFAITKTDFLEVAALLREALEENGVDPADVEHVHRAVLKREAAIVGQRA